MYGFLKITFAFVALILLATAQGDLVSRNARAQPIRTSTHSDNAELFQRQSPLKLPLASPTIVVKKSRRQLLLFSKGKLVRTYRVGLGLSPVGDKVRAGDRRTPEGEFYIFTKNNKSAFYLSLGLSYPNAAHAERGLRDGLITRA